jgi:predicted TIM-barrel fold metal-dependent hydrolase
VIKLMDGAGVTHAVLVQPSTYGWDNSYLASCLSRCPDRFAGVCLVDIRATDSSRRLRYWCTEHGFRGYRINLVEESDIGWLCSPDLDKLWACTISLDVPVSLHVRSEQFRDVGRLAERCPGLKIVVDSVEYDPDPVSQLTHSLGYVAHHANVYMKWLPGDVPDLSARWRSTAVEMCHRMRDQLGAERLMLGSDYPHVLVRGSYSDVVTAWHDPDFLDPGETDAIRYRTAAFLWGVGVTDSQMTQERKEWNGPM